MNGQCSLFVSVSSVVVPFDVRHLDQGLRSARSPSSSRSSRSSRKATSPLEQSLALYERGVQLSRFCHARLEEAERRIEILTERGELKPAPASSAPTTVDAADAVVAPAVDLAAFLEAARVAVDEALERYLPTPPACPRAS